MKITGFLSDVNTYPNVSKTMPIPRYYKLNQFFKVMQSSKIIKINYLKIEV